LLNRHPEENGVLSACQELNVALVAYRPLEGGRLKSNNVLGESPSGSPSSTSRKGKAASKEEAFQKTLKTIAHERRKSVSQVALNWLLRKDEHVIPGATSDRHGRENADTLDWELSHEEFSAIDQASSPWKHYTGQESRKLLMDVISFGVKRWFRARSRDRSYAEKKSAHRKDAFSFRHGGSPRRPMLPLTRKIRVAYTLRNSGVLSWRMVANDSRSES
jgi:hypothetical protein